MNARRWLAETSWTLVVLVVGLIAYPFAALLGCCGGKRER